MRIEQELETARGIAAAVAEKGGRVYFVGGMVRDALLGRENKDIDIEVYGITPDTLREVLKGFGEPYEKGASFGVMGLRHMDMDIAMPRTERRTGEKHTSFDVKVDPFLSPEAATLRRDFTMNAMMRDVLTGELIDCHGGQKDLRERVIRCVSPKTFAEDALRVFRAAQFAARLGAAIDPETVLLCRGIDVTQISRERVCEETNKALMKAEKPSVYFRSLRAMDHLKEFYPELERCVGVPQDPKYHPEGDVFEHTMLVIDAAAALRDRAKEPEWFMYAALCHDLGKVIATETREDGRVTAYGHEVLGLDLVERQLRRLTNNVRQIGYVKNMTELHMRPNLLALQHSRKCKTRMLFDLSVCPEDLILLARADGTGKLDEPYREENETFLNQRLEDYREIIKRPMVTGKDLIDAGLTPGEEFSALIVRARRLHLSGLQKETALKQVLAEYRSGQILRGKEDE